MSSRDAVPFYPKTRYASRGREAALAAQHSPLGNRLLQALPPEDYERLRPALEPVPLPRGWTLYHGGDRHQHLYFLTAGIVSRRHVMANGAKTEFALTGSEGVIGVASILGGESLLSEAIALTTGFAYTLEAARLEHELRHCKPLLRLLLRYAMALVTQAGQIAVCNRHHSVEQQLCRHILSSLDLLHSDHLTLTQEMIADSLGVRRESVTEAARLLQQAGLVRYSRGFITVLDRSRLETRACECYAVVRREYARLLPPASTTGATGLRAIDILRECGDAGSRWRSGASGGYCAPPQ
jgi:CRP-like cAMP-binding protein